MVSGRTRLEGFRRTNALCYKGLIAGLLVSLTALTPGCFFPDSLTVSFSESTVSISTTATWMPCTSEGSGEFNCGYFSDDEAPSRFTLSGLALNFLLIILDPLVVQFPAEASNFAGSFADMNSNTGGNLVITAGLSSVQVDATRSLTAEPSTQLVTIALPDGAPTAGDFALNLNFQLPPGTTSLEMKPLLTGQVSVNGQTFYPPLLPCMTDIAAVPTITTPLPVPGDTLLLPSIVGLGCQNATYDFGLTAIPTLP